LWTGIKKPKEGEKEKNWKGRELADTSIAGDFTPLTAKRNENMTAARKGYMFAYSPSVLRCWWDGGIREVQGLRALLVPSYRN